MAKYMISDRLNRVVTDKDVLDHLPRFLPAVAMDCILALPYFLRPMAAATAAGLLTLPRAAMDFVTALKRAPLPNFAFIAHFLRQCNQSELARHGLQGLNIETR